MMLLEAEMIPRSASDDDQWSGAGIVRRQEADSHGQRGRARPGPDWSSAGIEPRVQEILEDPIVRLVMRRDRLAAADVRAVIDEARRRLHARLHSWRDP